MSCRWWRWCAYRTPAGEGALSVTVRPAACRGGGRPSITTEVSGWVERAQESGLESSRCDAAVESRLTARPPPWKGADGVIFRPYVGRLPIGAATATKRRAAEACLGALPQCVTWIWTDGSVTEGVTDGGTGRGLHSSNTQTGRRRNCERRRVTLAPVTERRWWHSGQPHGISWSTRPLNRTQSSPASNRRCHWRRCEPALRPSCPPWESRCGST